MVLKSYGFIFIGPGYESIKRTEMNSELFGAKIVGVSSVNDGCDVAKSMVDEGVEVIELCGGFDKKGVRKIIDSVNGNVPVGSVEFKGDELQKLEKFLKD